MYCLFITKIIMESLPNEIILIIFNYIEKITDKRQLLRTCQIYNKITKNLIKYAENNFVLKYELKKNHYCVEKFTLELCHDLYFDMIPIKYYNANNNIIMELLATYNKLELIKFAFNNGCLLSFIIYMRAIQNNNKDISRWMQKKGFEWDCYTYEDSVKRGHLDVLIWATENGCLLGRKTCKLAAQYGHLDILKWARANGCDWDSIVCDWAANNGDLEMLKWARKNGCQWSANTCFYAAENGHTETLNWAIENGCVWNKKCYKSRYYFCEGLGHDEDIEGLWPKCNWTCI